MAAKKDEQQPQADAPQADAQPVDEQPKRLDQTVAGGRYRNADGVLVDAEGKPIKE